MNSQYRQTTSASVWCTTRHFTPDVTAVLSLEDVGWTAHRATPSSSFSVDELRERSLHWPCGTTDDLLCRSDHRRWFNIYVDDATNDDTVKLFDILSFVYSRSAAAACQFTYLSSRSHTRCVYCPQWSACRHVVNSSAAAVRSSLCCRRLHRVVSTSHRAVASIWCRCVCWRPSSIWAGHLGACWRRRLVWVWLLQYDVARSARQTRTAHDETCQGTLDGSLVGRRMSPDQMKRETRQFRTERRGRAIWSAWRVWTARQPTSSVSGEVHGVLVGRNWSLQEQSTTAMTTCWSNILQVPQRNASAKLTAGQTEKLNVVSLI